MIYEDLAVWKKHYEDWTHILENMEYNNDISKTQFENREKLIKKLIKEFKNGNTM